MKRLKEILVYALLFTANYAMAQTVNLTANDVTIEAGKTAELVVSLENSMDAAGWQMILYLPEGITLPYEEEDGEKYFDNTVVLSSRHLRSHICTVTETVDGGWLIMAYNPNKPTAIKEHSGVIATIVLKASENFSGIKTATVKNVSVADMESVQTDMVGDVTVKISCETTVGISAIKAEGEETTVYNVGGRLTDKDSKGLSIRRMSNGTTRKVVKK